MVKNVGQFRGSYYSRYKVSRDPSSGIEFVNRYTNPPGTHVYGADYGRKSKTIGEKHSPPMIKKRRG